MSFDDIPDAPVLVIGARKLKPRTDFPDSILATTDARIRFYHYVLTEELYSETVSNKETTTPIAVLAGGIVSRLARNAAFGKMAFQTTDIVDKGNKTSADSLSSVTRYTLKCNVNATSGIHLCMLAEWKKTTAITAQ
jgi:hypothetical protein